jgi:hypothetical protein
MATRRCNNGAIIRGITRKITAQHRVAPVARRYHGALRVSGAGAYMDLAAGVATLASRRASGVSGVVGGAPRRGQHATRCTAAPARLRAAYAAAIGIMFAARSASCRARVRCWASTRASIPSRMAACMTRCAHNAALAFAFARACGGGGNGVVAGSGIGKSKRESGGIENGASVYGEIINRRRRLKISSVRAGMRNNEKWQPMAAIAALAVRAVAQRHLALIYLPARCAPRSRKTLLRCAAARTARRSAWQA